MTTGKPLPAWARRLTELRRARHWAEADAATELKKLRTDLPSVESLTHSIRTDWESGRHRPGPRYRALLSALYDVDEAELFGGSTPREAVAGAEVLEALEVIGNGHPGTIVDGLGELIDHYAQTISALPPAHAYGELVAVRGYAGGALERFGTTPRRTDLTLACGWLSGLLAVAAQDMGQHAAARLWCSDAERRSEEGRHPELAGWAIFTRAMVAHYQRLPRQSADLAARGQTIAPMGTVVHAKLAAQEMRAAAMAKDIGTVTRARKHAAAAIAALPSDAPTTGAFSIVPAEDPPYTATSLLLAGHFREAVSATERVIQTVYPGEARQRGDNPSGYARSLLILGLAQAGIGEVDKASASGLVALAGSRPAWPTVALAGQLDHTLADTFPGASQAADYHARYLEVADLLRQPAPVSKDSE